MDEVSKLLTYRVRGIPLRLDRAGTKTLLEESLDTQGIELDSLSASSGGRQEQVATIRLSGRSAKLKGTRTAWRIPAVGSHISNGSVLMLDTHFLGFTSLYKPEDDEEHVLE